MKRIKLGKRDIYAIVDDDFDVKPHYCLALTSHGYVRANIYKGRKDGKYIYENIYLHHLVMGKPRKGLVTDHINRNKLDNRKLNLRHIKQSSNAKNKASSSGYKGVHYQKRNLNYPNKLVWVAQITKDYKCCHIGSFKSEIEAAKAYDREAKKLHGKYAVLNFY